MTLSELPFMKSAFRAILLLLPLTALADGESELRDAVTALARTSYHWETTTRQRFKSETTEPRLDPNAPVEVEGRFDGNGSIQIALRPSRELPVPVTAIWRMGEVVVQTPLGWLRRSEIRETPNANRETAFEGKQVRLSRFFSVALKVTAMRPLSEDLLDLIVDLKSCRREQGLILGELRDKTIEQFWGGAEAKRAPEIQGTVIFKIGDQGLTEFHVALAIGFPNNRTKQIAWSMQQWSTRLAGIGATTVELPEAAATALDK